MKTFLMIKLTMALSVILLISGCKEGKTDQVSPGMADKPEVSGAVCDSIKSGGEVSAEAAAAADTSAAAQNKLPRMLELGSVGCKPCEMMTPILDELRKEYPGKLSVEFYDVRKDNTQAKKYKIRLIPTQIFLDAEGKEYFRHEGFYPKEEIVKILEQMGVSQ